MAKTQQKVDLKNIRFFTLKEAAELARVCERTLRRYIQSGKLEAVKFGNQWKISDAVLRRALNLA